MTETNTPAGKRRTWRQAAIAGVALTALMGGLLAVDVVNRPEQQEKTSLSTTVEEDYTAEWERLKREAVAEGWTRAQLQEARDAVREDEGRVRYCEFGDAQGADHDCGFDNDSFTI